MSEEFRVGPLDPDENSISDIRKFFEGGVAPLQPSEFTEFWKSLSDEDKTEFKHANLTKT